MHHAELGEVHDVLALLADETERERADRDAGQQIAEHRAEPQALGDRHRDDRGGQVDERLVEEVGAVHQASSLHRLRDQLVEGDIQASARARGLEVDPPSRSASIARR